MNIKNRLKELAEDLITIANDHPANLPPVNLEVEAGPKGSIQVTQPGRRTETIAAGDSKGGDHFTVTNTTPEPFGGWDSITIESVDSEGRIVVSFPDKLPRRFGPGENIRVGGTWIENRVSGGQDVVENHNVLVERIFNWFDDDSAGAEAAGELFRLILPILTGREHDPARLTKANFQKVETSANESIAREVASLIYAIREAWNNAGRVPSYHKEQQKILQRNWRMLAIPVSRLARLSLSYGDITELLGVNEYRTPPEPGAWKDAADGIPSVAARKVQAGEKIERDDFFTVDGNAAALLAVDHSGKGEGWTGNKWPSSENKNPNIEIRDNDSGSKTAYWIGESDAPDGWIWPGFTEPIQFRFCSNCERWFAGPAKIDTKNTFCGSGCQNEFFVMGKDTEQGRAAAVLRSARESEPLDLSGQLAAEVDDVFFKREPIGSIQTPANNDVPGVADGGVFGAVEICSNCKRPSPVLDGFQWSKGKDDARFICSVNCLASAAGLLPNE